MPSTRVIEDPDPGNAQTMSLDVEPDAVPPWAALAPRTGRPLHAQIAGAIEGAISTGDLEPGHRLPPERQLARWFGVNRLTLRQALADLERRVLIRRLTGRKGGTFVAEPTVERDLSAFAGFSEQARRHGLVASSVLLHAREKEAPPDAAVALELAPGSPVFEVARLRLANGRPFVLEESSFPGERFAGLLDEPLDGSLYELLADRFDARPRRAVESLQPVRADKQAAGLLEVSRGAPLLMVERTAFDNAGAPVEFARDLFRGDRTHMVVWSFDVAPH
jgi:GntR family transcriptional regulator